MRKLILTLASALFLWVNAFAQNVTVTGTVTNEKGTPLEGVSVVSPDGKNATQTGRDGKYSISVPSTVKSLVFSIVNYQTTTKAARGVVNVTMLLTDSKLEEVVVVGYGTQQKKAFTGSASKIDAKEFATLLTPSIDKQLAGRAPGVQVTNSGGLANTPAVIRIRGIQSISGNNSPLIVVDGTPIITGNLAFATNSNALGDINPSDIESIDVLKDGSATAIYGSRAAGGVILITTKKGTKGRSKVTYDGIVGYSSPLKKFQLLNAADFVTIANEKLANAGIAAKAGVNTSAPSYNTDWQDLVMNNAAPNQSHTIALQGGTDKTTFYFSLNYNDQKGIVISNYNKSYRVRMNIDHELNKFVKLGNNLAVSRQQDGDQNNGSNSLGGAIASTLRLLPNVSPYDPNGWDGYNITYNPIASLSTNSMFVGPNSQSVDDNFSNVLYTMKKNKFYSDKYRFIDNAYIEVSPAKGFKFRSQVGIDMFNDYSYTGQNIFHGDGYLVGTSNNSDFNILRLVWSNVLNYNKTYRGHSVYVTVGHEAQTETDKSISGNGSSITDPFFIAENYITSSGTNNTVGGSYDKPNGFLSYFGRINYDYKNKYFLQGSIRRDGQSSLAPGYKYGNFPGFSVGWRPSEEKFWNKRIVNELKLKASYAKVGNQVAGYQYLTNFGARNYGNLGGIAPIGVGNPQLQWETSAKYDGGIEVGLLKNRITLTADYFLNDVNNLILGVPQPLSAGIPGSTDLNGGTIAQNIGKLENRGIELNLNFAVVKAKDFSWDLNVNYSKVNNKIKSLYSVGGVPVTQIPNGNYNVIQVGDPINIIWGYRSAGVNTANGNPMFYKADGSLVQVNLSRTTGTPGLIYVAADKNTAALGALSGLAATDKSNLGNSTPTYFGAFTNSFTYKNFGLDIMFRYSGGNKIMNYTRQEVIFNQSFQNNGQEILQRWTTPGQVTDVPKLYYGQAANINQTASSNSRFVEKGDYIRLQNLAVSYTFKTASLDKATHGYVKAARIFVQGQNLYVWSKYKGADPDNISTVGVDAAVSPQVRNVSFGVSLGF